VVHADRLAGTERDQVDAELAEVCLGLVLGPPGERQAVTPARSLDPARVAGVDHEPTRAGRDQPGLGLVELGLGDLGTSIAHERGE
jgi:hypothetical protein